ncbi:hypothetical protein D3C75_561320 [compost metagenome]
MARMERRLFVFGKEIIRVAIERHFAHQVNRDQFFRDQFSGVQQVKVILEFVFFWN